ncbi:MAG TPA: hypothetical protein VF665_12575 [Longimicrobium sp.]|uniref:hypothetical protein n=1 Tax=Longimicrobium sp. TaxID=2029185 RepID=UPI002EDA352F
MKIRAALPLLFLVLSLGACTGSATAPEARPSARAALDSVPPPVTRADSTRDNGGGLLGSGN